MTNYNTIPFVYRWDQLSTGMWYIGSHYKKGCHPDDGYLCSSKIVKTLIQSTPDDWRRTILEICQTAEETRFREATILQEKNARMDPMSYNQTNADGKFSRHGPHTPETRARMKANHADFSGKNNPMYGKTSGMKNKKHRLDSRNKISQSLKGRVLSAETSLKISQSLSGLSWINNGEVSKKIDLQSTTIPEGWLPGMLETHMQKLAESRRGENHWNYGKEVPVDTRQKISNSLVGRKQSDETKQKKKDSAKTRPVILCQGCHKLYQSCHKRYHISCESAENGLTEAD